MGGTEMYSENRDIPLQLNYQEILQLPSPEYITYVTRCAYDVIRSADYLDPETGYISQISWKKLVENGILASELHDRNSEQRLEEHMEIIRTVSGMDPQLGLMYGIMTALVIDNFHKFATDVQKETYFPRMRNGEIFGFAFTEKNLSGSTLHMNSNFTDHTNGTYSVNFEKRFQGLSGYSGLIVAALEYNNPGKLGLFIIDKEDGIHTEFFKTEGLTRIPYGYNTGHVTLTEDKFLVELSTFRNLETIQQIFTDSRCGFAAMSLGQQERIERLAYEYASERLIGSVYQKDMSIPQDELEGICTRRIITQAIYTHVVTFLQKNPDTRRLGAEASMIKTLTTEYAFESAMIAAKLMGGDAFHRDKTVKDAVDLWPFTIFEGNNDMLYAQIGASLSRKQLYHMEQSGGLFDRAQCYENLFPETIRVLDEISATGKTPVLEEILGKIASRCFALGCIERTTFSENEYMNVISFLNLQIQQLASEYFMKLHLKKL